MSSASSTFIHSAVRHGFTPCFCGLVTRVRTSRTINNPGKKFFVCPKGDGCCTFWEWAEDEEIEGLKNDILSLKKEVAAVRKKLVYVMVLLGILFGMYALGV